MNAEEADFKGKPAEKKALPPLSRRGLEALEFMVDHKVWLMAQNLMTSSVNWDRGNAHYRSLPKNPNGGENLGAPHVDFNVLESLRMRGYVRQLDKAKLCEKYGLPSDDNIMGTDRERGRRYGYFAWYDLPYGPTKEGFDFLESMRGRLAELRAADAARPEELIVVKGRDYGRHFEREADFAGALCRVVRRTPKRIYVEVIDRGVAGSFVQGSGGSGSYVDPADVFMEGVTRERFEAMKPATKAFMESIEGAKDMMEADIEAVLAPIRQRYAQRKVQLIAQYDDEVKGVPEEKPLEPKR
jgi:hypothetical protein